MTEGYKERRPALFIAEEKVREPGEMRRGECGAFS